MPSKQAVQLLHRPGPSQGRIQGGGGASPDLDIQIFMKHCIFNIGTYFTTYPGGGRGMYWNKFVNAPLRAPVALFLAKYASSLFRRMLSKLLTFFMILVFKNVDNVNLIWQFSLSFQLLSKLSWVKKNYNSACITNIYYKHIHIAFIFLVRRLSLNAKPTWPLNQDWMFC